MRRRDDHEPAYITVGRRVAETRAAAWTQKTRGAHFRVTHAQRRGRGIRQALREAHHHQVRAHLAACARAGLLLRWRGYKLEEEVLEVAFVHGDTEGTCGGVWDMRNGLCARGLRRGKDAPPVLSHSSRQIFVSAASATSEIRIRSLTQEERVSKILPGSTVVSEPKMINISREECVGRWL
jgi:hypothetical protein